MNKITQEEFDNLPTIEDVIQCPGNTDYSLITDFMTECNFGNDCYFGENTTFVFDCTFGNKCIFNSRCEFGHYCTFGVDCEFGTNCKFNDSCTFNRDCNFGTNCKFGVDCIFGECVHFSKGCTYAGHEFKLLYSFGGFGSVGRTTRVFVLKDKTVRIECGCQVCLTLEQFKERVEDTYKKEDTNYICSVEYHGMIALIEKLIEFHSK